MNGPGSDQPREVVPPLPDAADGPAEPLAATQLAGLFYSDPAQLAHFEQVIPQQLPGAYRTLLDHDDHMTVTVEDWHRSLVNLRVLSSRITRSHYCRKILLVRGADAVPVQFGIVRLKFQYLSRQIRQKVQAHQAPLGRILIQHNVMRKVQLQALWKVRAGPELSQWLGHKPVMTTFGRTAVIHCNGEAAIEVLEIVAPVD